MVVGLLNQFAQTAFLEHFLSRSFPKCCNWRLHPAHLMLKLLLSDLFVHVRCKVNIQTPVGEFHCAESHLKHEVLVQADQVFNGTEDGVKRVIDNVFSHLAGVGHWYGVGIDCAEALLVDRFLTAWRLDLLFAVVAVKVVRNFIVGYKSRLKVVHMPADPSFC